MDKLIKSYLKLILAFYFDILVLLLRKGRKMATLVNVNYDKLSQLIRITQSVKVVKGIGVSKIKFN